MRKVAGDVILILLSLLLPLLSPVFLSSLGRKEKQQVGSRNEENKSSCRVLNSGGHGSWPRVAKEIMFSSLVDTFLLFVL